MKSLEDTTCEATEVLIGRRELTDRLKELGSSSIPTPAETDNLSFDVLQNDIASVENVIGALGVIGTGGAVPFETTVAGDGTRQCWPNKPATVKITARDRNGALIRVLKIFYFKCFVLILLEWHSCKLELAMMIMCHLECKCGNRPCNWISVE